MVDWLDEPIDTLSELGLAWMLKSTTQTAMLTLRVTFPFEPVTVTV